MRTILGLCCALCIISNPAVAATPASSVSELADLDLEEFAQLDVLVTSVSKREQRLGDSAAAIFVVTREDIRRSGVASLPEALRMVPGVQVARIDSSRWAISARGFNGRFANKLLVLIDGRTIYNPLFQGVYWDSQDYLLEDIERIEVIRGPGATLWGANAVNGIINIITRRATDTQGVLASAHIGDRDESGVAARYGGQHDANTAWRVYAKQATRDSARHSIYSDARDDADLVQLGARLDRQFDSGGSLTVQGDVYQGKDYLAQSEPQLTAPFMANQEFTVDFDGFNLLGRWQQPTPTGGTMVQMYLDHVARAQRQGLSQRYDTLDVELQHGWSPFAGHSITVGGGYRRVWSKVGSSDSIRMNPESRSRDLFSLFVQDEITLLPDRWFLIAGSKFEHNEWTGWEIQPTLRTLYKLSDHQALWAAVSRAVKTPSLTTDIEVDQTVVPGAPPRLIRVLGNPDIESEELIAWEAGIRGELGSRFSYDIAAFYHDYDHLRTIETDASASTVVSIPVVHVVVPGLSKNLAQGRAVGLETSARWQATDKTMFQLAWSVLDIDIDLDSGSGDTTAVSLEGVSPTQQLSLRVQTNPHSDVDLDLWLRFVDELDAQGIDGYASLDARLAWRPTPGLELSLVGTNLLDESHPEFTGEIVDIGAAEIERGVWFKVLWQPGSKAGR